MSKGLDYCPYRDEFVSYERDDVADGVITCKDCNHDKSECHGKRMCCDMCDISKCGKDCHFIPLF